MLQPTSTPAHAKPRLPHFVALDGLRGVAAATVFVHHFWQSASERPQTVWSPALWIVSRIASFGYVGVDLFFVLSGFLITALLLIDRGERHQMHNFYWKRVLRIWPVLLVHCAVSLALFHSWPYVTMSLLFIANFASRLHVELPGPTWSLAIEEQFYLVWPWITRRLPVARLARVVLLMAALSLCLRLGLPLWKGSIDNAYTPYRLDGLGLGGFLACRFVQPSIEPGLRRTIAVLDSPWTLLAVFAAALAVLIGVPGSPLEHGLVVTLGTYATYQLMVRIVMSRTPAAFRWLNARWLVYLGAISYGMYMYHGFILFAMERRLGTVNCTHAGPAVLRMALAATLSVGAAVLSRHLLELPAQRLRRAVLR